MLRRKIVTLTNDQIKALPTTGITLVTAPGSGFYINVLAASFHLESGGGAYTNVNTAYATLGVETVNGDWLTLQILNDDTTTPDVTRLTDFLNAAHSALVRAPMYSEAPPVTPVGWVVPAGVATPSSFDNDLVRVKIDNNGSGNLTGGHASNTMRVTVYYVIEWL